MSSQWIGRLTIKQIIAIVIMIAVAIYIVWYVVEALEGLDPDYKPQKEGWHGGTEIKGEGGADSMMFDPNKDTPEAVPGKSMSRGE